MRAPRTVAGAVLITLGAVGLVDGVLVATSPAPLFSTIATGRMLAAASAVLVGLGVASAFIGAAYEFGAREKWGGVHPVGLAAGLVGLVLSVGGLIMATAPVCPGMGIDYMGPNGAILQRCLVPTSPFPIAAVGIAFLGGLVGGTIAMPGWRIAPSPTRHATPRRGR